MLTKLNLAVAIVAIACCSNLNAQDCGCGGGGYGYAPIAIGGGYGAGGYGGFNNCGREITQGNAAALWADYCTESCTDNGGLFGHRKGKCGKGHCGRGGGGGFGYGGGGGCCDQGCFGYPAGCGCGGGGIGGGCGHGGMFGGGRHGHGCKGGGRHGHCGGGCGRKGHHCKSKGSSCDSCCCGGPAPVQFSGGCDTCGCSGAGSYFSQPVGYDYGTAGMHSVVQGCASGACGGANVGGYQPAPTHAPSIIGEAVQGAATVVDPGQIPAN